MDVHDTVGRQGEEQARPTGRGVGDLNGGQAADGEGPGPIVRCHGRTESRGPDFDVVVDGKAPGQCLGHLLHTTEMGWVVGRELDDLDRVVGTRVLQSPQCVVGVISDAGAPGDVAQDPVESIPVVAVGQLP